MLVLAPLVDTGISWLDDRSRRQLLTLPAPATATSEAQVVRHQGREDEQQNENNDGSGFHGQAPTGALAGTSMSLPSAAGLRRSAFARNGSSTLFIGSTKD